MLSRLTFSWGQWGYRIWVGRVSCPSMLGDSLQAGEALALRVGAPTGETPVPPAFS